MHFWQSVAARMSLMQVWISSIEFRWPQSAIASEDDDGDNDDGGGDDDDQDVFVFVFLCVFVIVLAEGKKKDDLRLISFWQASSSVMLQPVLSTFDFDFINFMNF